MSHYHLLYFNIFINDVFDKLKKFDVYFVKKKKKKIKRWFIC